MNGYPWFWRMARVTRRPREEQGLRPVDREGVFGGAILGRDLRGTPDYSFRSVATWRPPSRTPTAPTRACWGGWRRSTCLVLDDWWLAPLKDQERRDLLEVFEDRHGLRSTVITSQVPTKTWHEMLADPHGGRRDLRPAGAQRARAGAAGAVDQEEERARRREEHGRQGLSIQASSRREGHRGSSRGGGPSLRTDPARVRWNGWPGAGGTGGRVERNTHTCCSSPRRGEGDARRWLALGYSGAAMVVGEAAILHTPRPIVVRSSTARAISPDRCGRPTLCINIGC